MMARLNIEDSLINDERFIFACNKIGRYQAMGQFVFLAKLAQRYWLENKLIPEPVYNLGEFSDVFLTSGLVEKKQDGFYLKGSEEHFSWIIAQKENGKRGGRPRKNNELIKANESQAKPNESQAKPNESHENPLTLTLSLAPTLSQERKEKEKEKEITNEPPPNLNPAQIVDLFNSKVAPQSKMQRYCSHSFPPQAVEDFRILIGYPDFSTLEKFESYFARVLESTWLTKKRPRSLLWLMKPDNAFKVISGEYQDYSDDQDLRVNPFGDES